MEGVIPRLSPLRGRLSTRETSFTETSATIVWKTLYQLRLQDEVVLWNALQMHPHRPGEPWSNRTPTKAELVHGRAGLKLLIEAFPAARLVAIGKKAAELLEEAGVEVAATVRHPANGGAREFADGMATLK